jgi:protein-disulfide isomerase
MNMNKMQYKAGKIRVLLCFATIITSICIGSMFVSSSNQVDGLVQSSGNSSNNNKLSFHSLVEQGSPFLGKLSAPITIVEFGDFQCDRCLRFAKYTEPQLNQTYIQTGKVNLVFKYFPIYGPDSTPAAMAAQCANDQGKFWNYYDTRSLHLKHLE